VPLGLWFRAELAGRRLVGSGRRSHKRAEVLQTQGRLMKGEWAKLKPQSLVIWIAVVVEDFVGGTWGR
jgi:hypothetical protein